jgi:hypothetical protein
VADKKASLILELKDFASAGLGKVSSAMGNLRNVALGVAAGVASVVAVMAKALGAYADQETAIIVTF